MLVRRNNKKLKQTVHKFTLVVAGIFSGLRKNLYCDSLLQFNKSRIVALLPYFHRLFRLGTEYFLCLPFTRGKQHKKCSYLPTVFCFSLDEYGARKKSLLHQNQFPFSHFLRMSVFLLCNTIIFTNISTLQESQTLQLSLTQVSYLKTCTMRLVHYAQGLLQLLASEMWKEKKNWKGCEWLRQLLEVTSSNAAKLPQIPPAEGNLKKDFFPCIKGPTSPLPRILRGFSPHRGMKDPSGRCLPHPREGLLKLHQHESVKSVLHTS